MAQLDLLLERRLRRKMRFGAFETSSEKKRAVVLGGGFGGVYAARSLSRLLGDKIKIVLVNERNYFLFSPLLHEVATGSIPPDQTVEPLRYICAKFGVDFCMTRVKKISFARKKVITGAGSIPFDYLIMALGSAPHFFGTPGADRHCLTLKSLEDAKDIKNKIIKTCERITTTADREEKRKLLQCVIIGGGPTGVELAAELSDLFLNTLVLLYPKEDIASLYSVTLLERSTELLEQFPRLLREKALLQLRAKKINVRCGTVVTKIVREGVEASGRDFFPSAVTIWTAGATPCQVNCDIPLEKDGRGAVKVLPTMQLKEFPRVFALGDMAAVFNERRHRFVPALAQAAVKEARHVARNIFLMERGKSPRPFFYRHTGDLISLGKGRAVGEIWGVFFSGRFAWWLWRTTYLFKMISFPKKIRVAVDWTTHLFLPRDISQI